MTLLLNWKDTTVNLEYNDVWGYVDSLGNEYAIFGNENFTYFLDVTDPLNPVLCDKEPGKSLGVIHRDYKTYKNYCYGTTDQGNGSLQIFDLQYLPDSVDKVYDSNTFFTTTHTNYIDTSSGRLYLAGANSTGLIVLDIATNPEQPAFLANSNLGSYVHDVYVKNDTAYCSNGANGLYIYDLTNPAAPQLISSDLIKKEILKDYKNEVPLLLITTKEPLNTLETQLLNKAQLIYKNEWINMYKLPLSAFEDKIAQARKLFESLKSNLYKGDNYLCSQPTESIIFQSFDDKKSEHLLFGTGALYKKRGKIEIYNQTIPPKSSLNTKINESDTIMLKASLWLYADRNTWAFPILHYKQYDQSNQLIEQTYISPKTSTEIYKNWVRVEHSFTRYNKHNRIEFFLDGRLILVDEFLIQPIDIQVYTHVNKDGSFVQDNYFIPASVATN